MPDALAIRKPLRPPTPSSVASTYTHPSDVTNDATLTIAEKRRFSPHGFRTRERSIMLPHCVGSIVAQLFLLMRLAGPWFRSMNRVRAGEKIKAIGFYASNAG